MAVTPEQTARALLARARERHAALDASLARVRAALPEVAARLRDLGATRVWVFGSVAWGGYHEDSDVDLAVEGLPSDRLLDAQLAAEEPLRRVVELFRIESLPASFAERIRAEGAEIP